MDSQPISLKTSLSRIIESMLSFFKRKRRGGKEYNVEYHNRIDEEDENIPEDIAEPDGDSDLEYQQRLLIESEETMNATEVMDLRQLTPMWRIYLRLQLQKMRIELVMVEQTRNLPADMYCKLTHLLHVNSRLMRAFAVLGAKLGDVMPEELDDEMSEVLANELPEDVKPPGVSKDSAVWVPLKPVQQSPGPGSPLSPWDPPAGPSLVPASWQPTPPSSPGSPSFQCPPTRVPAQSSETAQPMYKSEATWHPRSHGARPSGLSPQPSRSPQQTSRDQRYSAPPSPRTPPQWPADPLTSSDDEVGTVFVIPRRAVRANSVETLLDDFVEDAFVRNDTLNRQQALARSAELQGRLRELRTLEHEEGVSRYNLQFGYYRLAQGLLNRIDELTYNIDFEPKPPIIIYEDEEEPLASVMQTILLNLFCNLAFDETYLLTGEDARERLILVRDALNKLNELEETENVSQYSLQFGYDRLATALINTIQELEWLDPESATASFLDSTAHELLERTPIF